MLLTIKELGCTGFNSPVPRDCTQARLSLGARLPKGQAGLSTIPLHRGVKPSASLLFYCQYIIIQYAICNM